MHGIHQSEPEKLNKMSFLLLKASVLALLKSVDQVITEGGIKNAAKTKAVRNFMLEIFLFLNIHVLSFYTLGVKKGLRAVAYRTNKFRYVIFSLNQLYLLFKSLNYRKNDK
jgi:hypothetical protein